MSAQEQSVEELHLRALLAACVSASALAGDVIRDVVRQDVDLAMVNKADADNSYDPQTVADRRAQQRIVFALRRQWPHVQIVGEEGELAAPEAGDEVQADLEALQGASFSVPSALTGALDPRELVLWIDPLDGTKKFAAKQFDEVSVLVGIAYGRRPIAGVMHLPFHGAHGTTYWGGPGIGLFRATHDALTVTHEPQSRPEAPPVAEGLCLMTSGTSCPLMNEALRLLSPRETRTGGATGTMVLSVLRGQSHAFLRFRAATKRWDICAMEPLLAAVGGRVVDASGREYEYDPSDADGSGYDNAHGLVATLGGDVERDMLATMAQVQVLRTLEGGVMTPAWLEKRGVAEPGSIARVEVVAGSVQRGKQSVVAKLRLHGSFSTETEMTKKKEERVRHVFMKRYVQHELPPRSVAQWARDLRSYATEARFYTHVYEHLAPHVALITPLAVCFPPPRGQGDDDGDGDVGNAFIVLLEDVLATNEQEEEESDTAGHDEDRPRSGPGPESLVVPDALTPSDTRQALALLARMHASALSQPALLASVRAQLWPEPTWWSLAKRGHHELSEMPRIWRGVLTQFAPELTARGVAVTPSVVALAERVAQHASYISAALFGEASEAFAPVKTLVHGDFKTGNLFWTAQSRAVTVFDWQWAGHGLGVLDVANLLNTSVGMEALSDSSEEQVSAIDGEHALLRFYYDTFMATLQAQAKANGDEAAAVTPAAYPFEAAWRHYRLASLEYARVLLTKFWDGLSPARCVARATHTNCGLGYRSVPHVVRLVRMADEVLRVVEEERRADDHGHDQGPVEALGNE